MSEKFIELEVKFKVEESVLVPFKELMRKLGSENGEVKEFFFVEGYDHYYSNKINPDAFLRYRLPSFGDNKNGQITVKQKTKDANNIHRVELNIDVTDMNEQKMEKFAEMMGYSHNFSIYKYCHVYETSNALLSFYTVTEKDSDPASFIEIEVKEELMNKISIDKGMEIVRYYENKLSPLGVTYQKRVKKSLWETYKK